MALLDRLGHASSKAQRRRTRAALTARLVGAPELRAGRRAAAAAAMSLQGSSVLVTGGTRGIGLAIALRLVRDGAARVVLGYMRNDAAAEAAAEQVRAAGAEPVLVRGNVSTPRVVDELAAAGPYRVVVHNAATGVVAPGARDRRQALGLDDERERPRAARARTRDRAGDGGRLVDRRDLEPRLAARARQLRR